MIFIDNDNNGLLYKIRCREIPTRQCLTTYVTKCEEQATQEVIFKIINVNNIISLNNIINIIARWSSISNIISLISILNRVKNLYQSTYRVQCAIPSTFSITTINIIIIMITITITTNIIIITTININMSLKQGVLQLAEFSVHHPQDSGSEASLQGLSFKIDRHYPHQH